MIIIRNNFIWNAMKYINGYHDYKHAKKKK